MERQDIQIGAANFLPYESRSDKENRASVYAKASAPLKWPEDPYELLPGWVKPLADSAGIKPKAHIIVTPTIEAGAGGQFGLVFSEGTNQSRSGEFDVLSDRLAAMGIYSGRDGYLGYWLKAIYDGIKGSKRAYSSRTPIKENTKRKLKELRRYYPGVWYMIKTRILKRGIQI